MSSEDSSHSQADIITYIGVPLAVLGVVPIVYNALTTLITLLKIKRRLGLSNVKASTRSNIVNGVIEVEFPRYAVTPRNRLAPGRGHRQLSTRPSTIEGGSWMTFEWEKRGIGIKIQRVQYATQLRQPQAEVDFGDLVSYLHDLGAVPDEQGWKRLRSSGLWMPKGLSLMNSPDGRQKALVVASLDDSDGHLSLAATSNWSSAWIPQSPSPLPPNSVRLLPPLAEGPVVTAGEVVEASWSQEVAGTKAPEELRAEKDGSRKKSLDSPQEQADDDHANTAIICQVDSCGLSDARKQTSTPFTSTASHHILDIEHLRTRDENLDGVWFASAATAYRTTSQTIFWSYRVPDEIQHFAGRETVPCGVLVLLGIVNGSETPEWATRFDAQDAEGALFFERITEKRLATRAEANMSPEQRHIAASERRRTEQQQRMRDMNDQIRLENQSRAACIHDALQSPRWDPSRVAEHSLTWLRGHDYFGGSASLEDTVGFILHRMVLDRDFARSICAVLDLWKAWAGNGGMRSSDLTALQEAREVFAQASLLVALVADAATAHEQTLVDLRACIGMWKTVRLG